MSFISWGDWYNWSNYIGETTFSSNQTDAYAVEQTTSFPMYFVEVNWKNGLYTVYTDDDGGYQSTFLPQDKPAVEGFHAYAGAGLVVDLNTGQAGTNPDDHLSISDQTFYNTELGTSSFTVSGSDIYFAGQRIATVVGYGTGDLQVAILSDFQRMPVLIAGLANMITYSNSSDAPPATVSYSIDFFETDGSNSSLHDTINITPVEDPLRPTGTPATLPNVSENGQLIFSKFVLTQPWYDPDFVRLFVSNISVDHGSLTSLGNQWMLRPTHGYSGPLTISYTVSDVSSSVNGQVTVMIDHVVDPPRLTGTPVSLAHVNEDTGFNILKTALAQGYVDNDGDVLTTQLPTADHGTFVANGDSWTYNPEHNYYGQVTVHYNVSNGIDTTAASTSFVIDPVNDAPEPTSGDGVLLTSSEDQSYVLTPADLLTGFSDAEGDAMSVSNISVNAGQIVANSDGTYTIVPPHDFNGDITISYTVSDSHGATVQGTSSLRIFGVNDAPQLTQPPTPLPDGVPGQPYTLTSSQLLSGWTDIDGPRLQVTNLTAFGASVHDNGDGTFLLTSDSSEPGTVFLFYTVSDGATGNVPVDTSLNFVAPNQAPELTGTQSSPQGTEDLGLTITAADLLQGFTDANGDVLAVANLTASDGSIIDNGDGTWTFTAGQDASGAFDLRYNVVDGRGGVTPATISLMIEASNDAPVIDSNGGGDAAKIRLTENLSAVTTVTAQDVDSALLRFSISGGADADLFRIDEVTGALSFVTRPDFERPGDAGRDNVYDVVVAVSDGSEVDSQAIAVRIKDAQGPSDYLGTDADDSFTALKSLDWTISGLGGSDRLNGNVGGDYIDGGAGNDRLDGRAGADTMVGGSGDDSYIVDDYADVVAEDGDAGDDLVLASFDHTLADNVERLQLIGTDNLFGIGNGLDNVLRGNAGDNTLVGLEGNDSLVGDVGNDSLQGSTGNDKLVGEDGGDSLDGGAGANFLKGGSGADTFMFRILETSENRDTVKDFEHGIDTLVFDHLAFSALSVGSIGADQLATGAAATTSEHRLVYNPVSGSLFYDADGVGGAAQIQIAVLSTKPTLDLNDVYVV